jgi:hypothetical protein
MGFALEFILENHLKVVGRVSSRGAVLVFQSEHEISWLNHPDRPCQNRRAGRGFTPTAQGRPGEGEDALRLRRESIMTLKWIARRLHMETRFNAPGTQRP